MGRGKNSDKFKGITSKSLRREKSEESSTDVFVPHDPSEEIIFSSSTDIKEETKKMEIRKKKKQYMEDMHQHTAVSIIKDINTRKELADQHGIPFEEVSSPEDQAILNAIRDFEDKEEIDKGMKDIESGIKPAAPSLEAWWNDTQDRYATPSFPSK